MKKNYLTLAAAVIVIIAVIVTIQNPLTSKEESQFGIVEPEVSTANVGLNVGNIAPDFVLPDANGDAVKLSDYRGKVVFVNFWASWCPFCVDEMPDIQNSAKSFGDKVTVLFINRGEKQGTGTSYINFRLPVKIEYPILWDKDESVSKVYILYGMPVSYIIDESGMIKDRKFGPLTREEIDNKLRNVLGV